MAGLSRSALWAGVTSEVRAASTRLDEERAQVAEDAFPVAMADGPLAVLTANDVVVLGGDFYEFVDGEPQATGTNWFYEDADPAGSFSKARLAMRQPWVKADWLVTFVWRG